MKCKQCGVDAVGLLNALSEYVENLENINSILFERMEQEMEK